MFLPGYHLCSSCAECDWENDPVVRTEILRNLTATKDAKARCADCRTLIRVPRFRFCAGCAERERLCQHCCVSTLTDEERDAREAFDRWLESYRTVVNRHGIRSAEAKAHLAECERDDVRERLAGMNIRELDWPGRKIR